LSYLRIEKTFTLGLIIILIGVSLTIFTFYLAYNAYLSYKPILPPTGDLSQAITNTSFELINLVAKIAFLGVMLWASTILLRHGVNVIKAEKPAEKKQE
jgi:hypothetical protein